MPSFAATGVALAVLAVPSAGQAANWSAGSLPPGIGSLSAISCQPIAGSQHCVAVGTNATGSEAAIVAGGDGVRSWRSEPAPFGVTALSGVSCVSAQRCWAVGTSADGTQAVVVDTKDGGYSWVIEFLPLETSAIDHISCSGSTCVATGGSLAGQVLVTDDDGVTWTAHKLPGIYGATNATAATATLIYAVGGDQCGGPHVTQCPGAIWSSADGGSSWQIVKQGIPYGDAIVCADANDCLAASATFNTGTIEASSDGGRNWHPQKLPSFKGFFNSVSCRGPDCTAVGQDARGTAAVIVRTRDSGRHWTLDRPAPGTGALYGVVAIGPGTAQAVGQTASRSAATVLQVQRPPEDFRHSGALGPSTLAALPKLAHFSESLAAYLSREIAVDCNALRVCTPESDVGPASGFLPLSALQNAVGSLGRYAAVVTATDHAVTSLLAGPATHEARQRMRELASQLSFMTQAEFTELSIIDAARSGADSNISPVKSRAGTVSPPRQSNACAASRSVSGAAGRELWSARGAGKRHGRSAVWRRGAPDSPVSDPQRPGFASVAVRGNDSTPHVAVASAISPVADVGVSNVILTFVMAPGWPKLATPSAAMNSATLPSPPPHSPTFGRAIEFSTRPPALTFAV